ncbi:uncharacterized protein LOC135653103 isoform X2 [Musa acuminata AAA Group]|uniref:uncharacterized protein LOC103971201 isoform X2 n=1 Tax=Musa acuminata AAA Group TaxID=214697 RepID=UPI0008A0EA74|nr:PREDICTED: uncharacterized protein LOC103971201 isoform X2 [Musa acuminata subsp. malaccensis]
MLDNVQESVKRFVPPASRNRSINRRRSGGWAAAVHQLDDSSADVSVKPVMYSGASGSSWVHFKLPHQMDFLGELQSKIHKANSNLGSNTTDDN